MAHYMRWFDLDEKGRDIFKTYKNYVMKCRYIS